MFNITSVLISPVSPALSSRCPSSLKQQRCFSGLKLRRDVVANQVGCQSRSSISGLKLQMDAVDELHPRAKRVLDVLLGVGAVDDAKVQAFLIGWLGLVDERRDGLVVDVAAALETTNEQ